MIPIIQILRFLALLGVVVFHISEPALQGGFLGVDVFFVVSGFVITRSVAHQVTSGRFSMGVFLFRRCFRLLPALIFCLLFTLIFTVFFLDPEYYNQVFSSLPWSSLQIFNFYLTKSKGYFDIQDDYNPLMHTWTLGVEEQFYLVFALFVAFGILVFKRARPILIASAGVLLIGVVALPLLLSVGFSAPVLILFATTIAVLILIFRDKSGAKTVPFILLMLMIGSAFSFELIASKFGGKFSFYLPFCRAFEFIIGCLLFFLPQRANLNFLVRVTGVLVFLGLIVLCFTEISSDKAVSFLFYLLPCLATCGVIYFGSTLQLKSPFFTPFTFVGDISYSLYLWHWPMICFVPLFFDSEKLGSISLIVTIVLFFGFAVFSYYFVEKPIVSKAKLFLGTKRSYKELGVRFAVLVLIMGLVPLFSYILKDESKSAWRFGSTPRHDDTVEMFRDARIELVSGEEALLKKMADQPEVVLIGDSHASHSRVAVECFAASRGLKFHSFVTHGLNYTTEPMYYLSGKPPSYKALGDVELAKMKRQLFAQSESIQYVFIAQYSESYIYLNFHIGALEDRKPSLKLAAKQNFNEVRSHLQDSLKVWVDELVSAEKKVVLIQQVPMLDRKPTSMEIDPTSGAIGFRLLRGLGFLNGNSIPKLTVSDKHLFEEKLYDAMDANPSVYHFKSRKHFSQSCSNEGCLYMDDNHLSRLGGGKLADHLVEELNRVGF